MNVKNRIFRPQWKPELAAQFTETLEKENIEDMMLDINSILVEFPDNASIDNLNQTQYKINELVSKVGNLLKTTARKIGMRVNKNSYRTIRR